MGEGGGGGMVCGEEKSWQAPEQTSEGYEMGMVWEGRVWRSVRNRRDRTGTRKVESEGLGERVFGPPGSRPGPRALPASPQSWRASLQQAPAGQACCVSRHRMYNMHHVLHPTLCMATLACDFSARFRV
eukprot:356387-Chlamydomonas_euryale.AAC.10